MASLDTFLYSDDQPVPSAVAERILAGMEAILACESEPLEDRLARLVGALDRLVETYHAPQDDDEWVDRALASAPRALPATPYWMYPREVEPLGLVVCLMLSAAHAHVFELGPLERAPEERFFLPKDLELMTTRFDYDPASLGAYLRERLARRTYVAEEGLAFHVHFTLLAFAAIRYAAVCLAIAEGRADATRPDDVASAAAAFELTTTAFPMFDQAVRQDVELGARFRDRATASRLVGVLL